MRSRRSWRAGACNAPRHRLSKASTPVLHHTAGTYGLTAKSTVADEQAAMRRIQAEHRARGFNDIGYSEVIMSSGRSYKGRGYTRVPAAAIGFNTGNWHIALVGNFETGHPTERALRELNRRIRAFRRHSGSKRRVVGHFQVNPTACPGKHLKSKLDELA